MIDPLMSNSVLQRPEREFTYEELHQRGLQAQQLLGSEMFREALQEAEYALLEELTREEYPVFGPDGDVVGYRDPVQETYAAKRALLGLGAVERALRAFIADGEAARNVLQAGGAQD